MPISRRDLFAQAGTAMALGALSPACARAPKTPRTPAGVQSAKVAPAPAALGSWDAVRDQFLASRDSIHLASFLISSHPRPVREAIERHRQGLDVDPYHYIHENYDSAQETVLRAAAKYMEVQVPELAMTDSTTMGLGLLYQGLELKTGQEILTTTHDHYSTHESLRLRSERHGVAVRKISLFDQPQSLTEAEVKARLAKGISRATRFVAITWVHSNTGVKLPIRAMADVLAKVNASRSDADRVILCVDGVHGLAVEDATMADLGCDFFVAGCHKWLHGPRGTGLMWAKSSVAPLAAALFPTMSDNSTWGGQRTPGGFHSFEHRWALDAAFDFHLQIGKSRITARIHELTRQLKEGMAKMGHVTLYTPMSDALSAGMVCFDVRGRKPQEVVDRLWQKRIIASTTPYDISYARLAPSILNSPAEIEKTLEAIRELA